MPHFLENKDLQSSLDTLIISYETEINYTPIEIELNPKHITPKDISALLNFVSEGRKRLFIFKIPGDEENSNRLALAARRSVLNQTAEKILQSTSLTPKINPLKAALQTKSSSVRAGIQIQRSFEVPKPPKILKDIPRDQVEHIVVPDLILVPAELPNLPELTRQLKVLGINNLQDTAAQKINEHYYAFTDGIIPNNLPAGFYINKEKQSLCFTDSPRRLPSALAPVLAKPEAIVLPSIEQIQALLPATTSKSAIELLIDSRYSLAQKNALMSVLPAHSEEIKAFLQLLSGAQPPAIEFIVPFLSKQFILGGEAHTALLTRLLNTCVTKKLSLEFLKNPYAQNAFLSTRGIKNLQKLAQLPAEQKEWWNTLVTSHLNSNSEHFDFNAFFEAYTQIFLPRIAEKNLTLPTPCPIEHNGHLLITLNRVLDVLEHAENPQEQCLSLSHLNWGATGVHYAMTQIQEPERLKQVASCMKIESPEDVITNPELIYQKLGNENFSLKPWLFRYLGQHWKAEIRLPDIQAQLHEIETLDSWSPTQKKQLTFILTCTFSDKTALTNEQWKNTLSACIDLLQPLNAHDRSDLLQALSRCFKFKPGPSFEQIKKLMQQCIDLKTTFPAKNFKEELLKPLISCLEHEGFDLLNTLQERIQKTASTPEDNSFSLSVISSFTTLLQSNRSTLDPDLINLLAKLNEPDLTQIKINNLLLVLKTVETNKGEAFHRLLISTLSQINISKSQPLPKIEQIEQFINNFSNSDDIIPAECNTLDKQQTWLKNLIIDRNSLPGCVLGNGDISKLDDLIVDSLVDAVKKRSAAFRIDKLKAALLENLQSIFVPQQLRDQLNEELMPLFDATNDLVKLLQSSNPKFPDVIDKLEYFERKKPKLLDSDYGVGIIGKTKGEYILSFLLTGKRKATDNKTGSGFATILSQLHGLFISEMTAFFNDPKNKQIVKDLDIKTSLSWMAAFNDTHSLTFFFKEELVQKKVLPALRKTLQQLNTQDPDFEKSILDEAAMLNENEPSNLSLQNYKNKIEAIANYLNLLIDVKDRLPAQFNTIYKKLNTGALARLNYSQKHILTNKLIKSESESLDLYLNLATQALEENPEADGLAIERAINGLVELFNLADLEPETQIMFFKMSMTHNLKSPSPFPLEALNKLKKSDLPEKTKSLIIKHIIQILSHLSRADSPELVQGLVQQTQLFLTNNPEQADLCIALLKRVFLENPNQDLGAYPVILQQLDTIAPENREKIAIILTGLANSKKDTTVNLPALLEVTKGLGRRTSKDIDEVLKLFATPPYPNTQRLNSALMAHDSEKLLAFCLSFDKNPFAETGEKRDLAKQFTTDRVQEALLSLNDLIHEVKLPHSLQLKLAKQLTFIETLGYTDPLNPDDFQTLKELTARSRNDLKERAVELLLQIRSNTIEPDQREIIQLELLAYLREIYFRTTGLFPNTTQMLVLLLAMFDPSMNLLMRIKTGEGKSINTPMLSVLQWAQGGTVDQCTANPTLLIRDFENNCAPFFKFLNIETALIQSDSNPADYKLNGINCSTVEDMSIFRLAAKEAKKEKLIVNDGPVHIVLDECDDALLDQTTLFKLVAEMEQILGPENNTAQWIYPLAYRFINLTAFRNLDSSQTKVWDEEEDLEQFRLFLNKEINERFNGDADKQNYLMACSNTQLMQWIHASCIAALRIENKHFIVQPIKVKDEAGQERIKKIVCVPLIRSTPKTGSIFTEGVQQALQARLIEEHKDQAHYFVIDPDPPVLASQSARGLIKFYLNTKGRLVGISATPGDKLELQSLSTQLGTQAIGVAPYAGDTRVEHPPVFTFNNDETIAAIHQAIDSRKLPITKPKMVINADVAIQTYEEREALIVQTKKAIDQWSLTQTQPILIINEDFDASQNIEASMEAYRQEGFKIQIVTGKESPEELEAIIKQARKPNTITIGTAMLAKGIDIDIGDHPRGLLVIQTYTDTDRMTTQIAGRAGRNGKPGEWLPIYQIKPPQSLLDKFLYYIFPWYRQSINEYAVQELKNKIKLQATVDRLYTQAIDEVQQTVMQQIEAWESLLLKLYPGDQKIQFDLYQWRETLLNELTRSQETSISESTLTASISHFKNAACKLWESAREEQWAKKAQNAAHFTAELSLRFNYLKQLELTHELNVQSSLQPKNKHFTDATEALMHQNLETMIQDKAGVVLDYKKPTGQLKKDLELAQCKQLLPGLIGKFCAVYPLAVNTLDPQNPPHGSSFLPQIVSSIVNRVIEHKNKVLHPDEQQQISQDIIQYYEQELKNADSAKIQTILTQIKPLFLNHSQELSKASLIDQFKMQGLILTFCTLYQNSGLPEDVTLNELKISYDEEIMKRLATHLLEQCAWVKEVPEPLHALFERSVAKQAAHDIYDLARNLIHSPQDKDQIQALYAGLEKHRAILKDKYLFSIGHSSPRGVITDALEAIETLNYAPHCDRMFRDNCHDNVLAEFHLEQFRDYLAKTSPYFYQTNDPTWNHLKKTLTRMSLNSKNNKSHVIHELHEAITRFTAYEAYKPYLKQLRSLDYQLVQSIAELSKADGLKQDIEESLLTQKTVEFARLFNVDPNHVRIQSGTDGIQSFIELQLENTSLKEGFKGYQSTFFSRIEIEKNHLKNKKTTLDVNQRALLELSDRKVLESLPESKRANFERLFKLNEFLATDWNNAVDVLIVGELPELTQSQLKHLEDLKKLDWTSQPVDLNQLTIKLGKSPDSTFTSLLDQQERLTNKINEIQDPLNDAKQKIADKQKLVQDEENVIKALEERQQQPDCTRTESLSIMAKLAFHKTWKLYYQRQLAGPEKALMDIQNEENKLIEERVTLNRVLDNQRPLFISGLIAQAKNDLTSYIQDTSQALVSELQQEVVDTDSTIDEIQKTESQKSRYQTRRFFNCSELLRYEASLQHEETQIPQKSAIEAHPSSNSIWDKLEDFENSFSFR